MMMTTSRDIARNLALVLFLLGTKDTAYSFSAPTRKMQHRPKTMTAAGHLSQDPTPVTLTATCLGASSVSSQHSESRLANGESSYSTIEDMNSGKNSGVALNANIQRELPRLPSPPSWITLPNRLSSNNQSREKTQKMAFDVELFIGRIAMVGGLSLIVKELLTGESFTEQFVEAFTNIM